MTSGREEARRTWLARATRGEAMFERASDEVLVLSGLASPVGWLPGRPSHLHLTDRRLVLVRPRPLLARLLRRRKTVIEWELSRISSVRVGSRWASVQSGLWGACTLRIDRDGLTSRLSVYGAETWKREIEARAADFEQRLAQPKEP